MRHCTRNEKSKFNFMLVLCSVYDIMIFSEICEYLDSGLKVPTEINGFQLSIDATVPETKNRKSNFMLVICSVYAIMIFREVCEISRLWVKGSN